MEKLDILQPVNKRIVAANNKLTRALASPWFFYVTLALFAISALWVATASLYPMAFDEDFHMGLIKIYASNWFPYGIEHTRDMATYGAATADASYLFHYLLSMPYGLLKWLGLSEDAIVVALRCINIGFVVVAIWLYKKALLAAGASRALTHSVLALFCLIPVFVLMAGQVNYDNLLLIIVALAMWLLIQITTTLKKDHRLPAYQTWLFLGVILIGMPIKYAFLPIALGLLIWFLGVIIKYKSSRGLKTLLTTFVKDSRRLKRAIQIGIIAFFAAGIFFSAHYVTNYITYGSPIPECDSVFNEDACTAYSPWNRDMILKNSLNDSFKPVSLPIYIAEYWVPGMFQRLTFALAGPTNDYQTKLPLPTTVTVFSIITAIGILCFAISARSLLRAYPIIWLFLLVTSTYLLPLIWKLYQAYVLTGQPVAINGRYLLPLLPFIGVVLGLGVLAVMRRYKLHQWSAIVATVCLLLLAIGGGGVGTYIVLAESGWFWNSWGQTSHHVLKAIFSIFILH